jgi:hypothetical protein
MGETETTARQKLQPKSLRSARKATVPDKHALLAILATKQGFGNKSGTYA